MNSSIEEIKKALKGRMCNKTLDEDIISSLRDHIKYMGFVEGDRSIIDLLIDDYVRVSDELAAQVDYLDQIGEFDPNIQISNRNSILRVIEREWEGSKRYHTPTSLILFCVDGLDQSDIEDTDTVNQLFIQLAKLIDRSTRLTDTFGRLDENKFVLVVPTTNNVQASWLGDKLRETIADYDFDDEAKITCSFGVAESNDSMSAADWLEIAEAAYEEAKKSGGNILVDYHSLPPMISE